MTTVFLRQSSWSGLKRASLATVVVCGSLLPLNSTAQIPVTDIALNVLQGFSYAEQLLQYAEEVSQMVQMYEDYALQLQNLTKLPGEIRGQIEGRLNIQLTSNLHDFGVSFLGAISKTNPDKRSFYSNTEELFRAAYGSTPRTTSALAPSLEALGIRADMSSPIYKASYQDRLNWERMLDDMRHTAVARQNAEDRSAEATSITAEMKSLGDNNTVGAVQLLAAQQSLGYAQQEDLLKTQAQALRVMQQHEAQALAEQDDFRQHELTRLTQVQSRPMPTSGDLPVF